MHNGSNAMSPDNCPDKESNTGGRDKVGFGSEEMANLVHWKPNCRQAAYPEDEEASEVPCVCS